MQTDLLMALRKVARTLLVRRALESAAVGAAVGGYCAAIAATAWWIPDSYSVVGGLLCVVEMAAGLFIMTRPGFREAFGLRRWSGGLAGAAFLGAGLLAGVLRVACRGMGFWPSWLPIAPLLSPSPIVPAACMLIGAIAGAVPVLLRGVSPLAAGVFLDVRAGLCERLSTAAEADLAGRDEAEAVVQALWADASAALAAEPMRRISLWRRSRATLGALLLAGALCAATAALPDRKAARSPELDEVAGKHTELTPEQLAALVREFERASAQKSGGGPLPQALRDAADALRSGEDERIAIALERLQEALAAGNVGLSRLVVGRIQLAVRGSAAATGAAAATDGVAASRAVATPPDGESAPGGPVLVYDPLYAEALRMRPALTADRERPRAAPSGASVAIDSAWLQAARRAEQTLVRRDLPGLYRRIARRYFLSGS